MNGARMLILTALLRLRQAACHPVLADAAKAELPSAKLDALLPALTEIAAEGHKAVVFSQFTSFLALVQKRLDKAGLPYEYLDGRVRDRQARVDRFQEDPATPLFLVSLKAGGHGLNLTAADYVYLLDPWWNPAVEAQAIDRAHRIGQTRRVIATRLVARGTIEEKILALQASKRALADAILGADQGVLAKIGRAELEALLAPAG
jgi:SNF2 family DNA or RNA helicase